MRMELKFSYWFHAVKPCLHSTFGTNEFGDRQLRVAKLFKIEWVLRLQEEEEEEVLSKGIKKDNYVCVTASDIKTLQ